MELDNLYSKSTAWKADRDHPNACPVLLFDEQWIYELLQDHREFKEGHLRLAPPVIDAQPAKWLDYMREIGSVFGEALKERSNG